MEDIGTRCELSNCKTVDFCPFLCRDCNGTFCREHSRCDEHACPRDAVAPQAVIDTTWKRLNAKKRCQNPHRCRTRLGLSPFVCKECEGAFCTNHRFPEDHDCKGLEEMMARLRIREPIPVAEEKTEEQIAKEKAKEKASAMRALLAAVTHCDRMREIESMKEEEADALRTPLWTDALRLSEE